MVPSSVPFHSLVVKKIQEEIMMATKALTLAIIFLVAAGKIFSVVIYWSACRGTR